jgi:hypothetical protein
MRGFKKIKIILILFMSAIFVINTDTYAFLSSKKTNEKNQITTGTYPKPFAKMYASVGPLYKGYFPDIKENKKVNSSYESPNYGKWLENASDYILKDIEGKTPAGAIGTGYAQFLNIPNNNTNEVSQLNNIASTKSNNWASNNLPGNQPDEYGTLVHNLIAIGTPIKEGMNFGKIKVDENSLAITQTDVFQSTEKKDSSNKLFEYRLVNENSKVDVIKSRAVTFDYKDGKYVKTGVTVDNKYTPAAEADLIIYDAGNIGFSNLSLTNKDENSLKELGDMLTANASHAIKDNPNDKEWKTRWDGEMGELVLSEMHKNGDSYCRLDRTECTVSFKYNQYEIPMQKYIINYLKK